MISLKEIARIILRFENIYRFYLPLLSRLNPKKYKLVKSSHHYYLKEEKHNFIFIATKSSSLLKNVEQESYLKSRETKSNLAQTDLDESNLHVIYHHDFK